MRQSMRNANAFAVTIGFQTQVSAAGHLVGPKSNHIILPGGLLTYRHDAPNGPLIREQCLNNGFQEVY